MAVAEQFAGLQMDMLIGARLQQPQMPAFNWQIPQPILLTGLVLTMKEMCVK